MPKTLVSTYYLTCHCKPPEGADNESRFSACSTGAGTCGRRGLPVGRFGAAIGLSYYITDIVNSLTSFCQLYGSVGWPALLRQELPDLTDEDIEWLSDLSEEMEQYERRLP